MKLSDYYGKTDASPFYTWAASKLINVRFSCFLMFPTVLDPRIMYSGLETDTGEDPTLLGDLQTSKLQLQRFYERDYAPKPSTPANATLVPSTGTNVAATSVPSQKINFTSRYQRKHRVAVNELEEFFKLEPEDFGLCEPLAWWRGRRSQFPNLYRLACDVLSIPGTSLFRVCCYSGTHVFFLKAPLSPSKGFSPGDATRFLCDVQVTCKPHSKDNSRLNAS